MFTFVWTGREWHYSYIWSTWTTWQRYIQDYIRRTLLRKFCLLSSVCRLWLQTINLKTSHKSKKKHAYHMLFDPTKILLATHASNWYLTTSQVQVSTTSLFIGLNVNFSSIFLHYIHLATLKRKTYDHCPTSTTLTRTSNAGGVWKNHDLRLISRERYKIRHELFLARSIE